MGWDPNGGDWTNKLREITKRPRNKERELMEFLNKLSNGLSEEAAITKDVDCMKARAGLAALSIELARQLKDLLDTVRKPASAEDEEDRSPRTDLEQGNTLKYCLGELRAHLQDNPHLDESLRKMVEEKISELE